MTALAFVDTETTGLDPERHEVWEVALILHTPAVDGKGKPDEEYTWFLPVDLGKADAIALSIGRFYERHDSEVADHPTSFAADFARLTHGAHLVGAVPSFDDAFLKRLLRKHGECPGWHYHLVDVENLASGQRLALASTSGFGRPGRSPSHPPGAEPCLNTPARESSCGTGGTA